MEPAHIFAPALDWDRPPPPERPNARLYLPGNECIVRSVVVPFEPPPVDPDAPPTTVPVDPEVPAVTTTLPPPVVITEVIPTGTTIPPDVLDRNAPLPSLPVTDSVGPCR